MAEDAESAVNDEEVWACLSSADLAADLATLDAAGGGAAGEEPSALGEEVTRMLGEAAVISTESEEKIVSSLQQLCADAQQLQFNLASMVAKVVAPGPLAPPCDPADNAQQKARGQQIFGQQVVPPSAPGRSWPSGAQSLTEYEQRLAALPDCVAITRELPLSLSKLDSRQDEKDINRDTLEVNGLEVKGSEGGYHKAVATISEVLSHVGRWRSKEAAQLLLSILNRTTSGFMAFEEVLKLLENSEVVISPQSAEARPLELAVVADVAMGRAHTRYAVHRADASGQLLAVDAFVCFKLEVDTLRKLVEERLELQVTSNILIYKSGT